MDVSYFIFKTFYLKIFLLQDTDEIKVSYPTMFELLEDLRGKKKFMHFKSLILKCSYCLNGLGLNLMGPGKVFI